MKFKSISFYLGLFCFPISILSFINILYSSYFDFFLSLDAYLITLFISFILGSGLCFYGKKSFRKINFIEQLILIILVYLLIGLLISLPFYLKKFGIKYHKLFISKPSADIYIDDKAYGYKSNWIKKLKKLFKV